jgi:sulfur-oxidizing protein SoxY
MEKAMMQRREVLTQCLNLASMLAALGLLPRASLAQSASAAGWNAAAFEAKNLADVMRALGSGAPAPSPEVTITAPDIAENGAVVPVVAATALPGAKRLMLLVEKNPATLSAVFDISEVLEPQVATRIKMAQTSNVFAVAIAKDDRVYFASKEVKVTLGGCGG